MYPYFGYIFIKKFHHERRCSPCKFPMFFLYIKYNNLVHCLQCHRKCLCHRVPACRNLCRAPWRHPEAAPSCCGKQSLSPWSWLKKMDEVGFVLWCVSFSFQQKGNTKKTTVPSFGLVSLPSSSYNDYLEAKRRRNLKCFFQKSL